MRRLFFTGLISLLPLALTFLVVSFVFNILTTPFQGAAESLLAHYNPPEHTLYLASRIMALLLLLGLITLIGFLGRLVAVKSLFNLGALAIYRIPFVNRIYKAIQDGVQSVFGPKGSAFSQAVYVPFPHSDAYSIGLIAKKQTPEEHDEDVFVFIPGAPNPTGGYMLSYKYEEIIFTDMRVDEAVKFIVTCGVT